MKQRYIAPLLVCVTLAVPASASAHSRAPAVALDYRLVLDPATKSLPGVSVSILDGDRDLHIRVRETTVTIRGDLGEPMLRIEPSGTWVNRASVTAVAEKLTTLSHGWRRSPRAPGTPGTSIGSAHRRTTARSSGRSPALRFLRSWAAKP